MSYTDRMTASQVTSVIRMQTDTAAVVQSNFISVMTFI